MTHKVMCIIKLLRIIKFLFFITTPAHIEMNVLFYEILIATKRKNVRSINWETKDFPSPSLSRQGQRTHTRTLTPKSQATITDVLMI